MKSSSRTPTRTSSVIPKRFELLVVLVLSGCTAANQEVLFSSADVSSRVSSDTSSQASSDATTQNPAQQRTWALAGSALAAGSLTAVAVSMYFIERRSREDAGLQAQAWLNANRSQLIQDLALGAGPALDDLAMAAQVRGGDRARFQRLMRAHRRELLALIPHRHVSLQEAVAMMRRTGALTRADEVLGAWAP